MSEQACVFMNAEPLPCRQALQLGFDFFPALLRAHQHEVRSQLLHVIFRAADRHFRLAQKPVSAENLPGCRVAQLKPQRLPVQQSHHPSNRADEVQA